MKDNCEIVKFDSRVQNQKILNGIIFLIIISLTFYIYKFFSIVDNVSVISLIRIYVLFICADALAFYNIIYIEDNPKSGTLLAIILSTFISAIFLLVKNTILSYILLFLGIIFFLYSLITYFVIKKCNPNTSDKGPNLIYILTIIISVISSIYLKLENFGYEILLVPVHCVIFAIASYAIAKKSLENKRYIILFFLSCLSFLSFYTFSISKDINGEILLPVIFKYFNYTPNNYSIIQVVLAISLLVNLAIICIGLFTNNLLKGKEEIVKKVINNEFKNNHEKEKYIENKYNCFRNYKILSIQKNVYVIEVICLLLKSCITIEKYINYKNTDDIVIFILSLIAMLFMIYNMLKNKENINRYLDLSIIASIFNSALFIVYPLSILELIIIVAILLISFWLKNKIYF